MAGAQLIRRAVRLSRVQDEFCADPSLYRAFVGGIGSGKSWVGAFDLITRALPGRTYAVVGPTYTSLQDSSIKSFLALAREFGVLDPSQMRLSAPPQLTLTTGATVVFRSGDHPESLRGPNLSGVWLDEASLMPELVYRIAIGRLREAGEQGWLSATFTPKGPAHWTYETFATGRPNTRLFRARTRDNPFITAAFERSLQEQYGDTLFARQELGGEFVAIEGAEFPAEWFGAAQAFDAWPDDLVLKVIALDPSKGTSGDGKDFQAHVLVGVAVEVGRYIYYVDADLDRLGVVQMCDRTAQLTRQFNAGRMVDSVVCEENATMGLLRPALDAAAVRNRVMVPYILRTNTDPKEFRIRYFVGPPLSRGQLRFRRTPGARTLVGQLQSFPHAEFDDAADALATALRRVAEMLQGAA